MLGRDTDQEFVRGVIADSIARARNIAKGLPPELALPADKIGEALAQVASDLGLTTH